MARTPRVQRPVRRTLWRNVRAPKARDAGAPANLLATVESTVVAVLRFVERLFRTFVQAAFRPARLSKALADGSDQAQVLGPYTFMCLSGFYAVKLLKLMLVLVFILSISIFKGCESETTEDLHWPSPAALADVPPLNELLLIGLPLIAATLALSWLLWKMHDGRNLPQRHLYMNAACYCFGLEFLLLLPGAVLLSACMVVLQGTALYAGAALVFLAIVLWPAFSIFRMLGSLTNITLSQAPGRLRRTRTAAASVLASVVMAGIGLAMAYSAAQADFQEKYEPKVMLRIAAVGPYDLSPSGQVSLLLWNNTATAMHFVTKPVTASDREGNKYEADIIGMPGGPAPALQLRAGEGSWVTLQVQRAMPRTASFFLGPRDDEPLLVCLRRLGLKAGSDRVCARVGSDKSTHRACNWREFGPLCLLRGVDS